MMDDTRRFTDDLDKATILGAIARGWCHEENVAKEMDGDLAGAIADEVEQVITALRAQVEALTADVRLWMLAKEAVDRDVDREYARAEAADARADAIAAVTVAKCADAFRRMAPGAMLAGDVDRMCDAITALSPLDPVKAAARLLLAAYPYRMTWVAMTKRQRDIFLLGHDQLRTIAGKGE